MIQNLRRFHNRYVAFDFHKECGTRNWHRLSILLEKLEDLRQSYEYVMFLLSMRLFTDKFGHRYFFTVQPQHLDAAKVHEEETSHQNGVFRTNCVDCLDRTNVVQSMLARLTLQDQLRVRVFASFGKYLPIC